MSTTPRRIWLKKVCYALLPGVERVKVFDACEMETSNFTEPFVEASALEAKDAEIARLKREALGALSQREIHFEQENARLRTEVEKLKSEDTRHKSEKQYIVNQRNSAEANLDKTERENRDLKARLAVAVEALEEIANTPTNCNLESNADFMNDRAREALTQITGDGTKNQGEG